MNREFAEVGLSPVDRERRAAMRGEMIDAFVALHRSRRIHRRVAGAVAGFTLMAGSAWVGAWLTGRPVVSPAPSLTDAVPLIETIETAATGNAIEFAFVTDSDASLVRYVDGSSSMVQTIDNATLIETLAEMNRPAGLIEMGGTVRLTRNVVDDDGSAQPAGRGSRLDSPLGPGDALALAGV